MANEVAEVKQTFSDVMLAELESKKAGLPSGFNADRFVLNAVSLINEHPELQKFGANQLKTGLIKGAVLDLNFYNREAYLIPYGSQLQFQIDWRGAKKIAKKYSIRPIKDINAEIVREGDTFKKIVNDSNTTFSFEPIPFNDNKIVGAFAYIQFEDGGCQVETMTLADLENTRKKSKMANGMAWKDFTEEMYKKTVLHRICKKVELSFENNEQFNLFNDDVAIDTKQEKVVCDNPFSDTDGLEEI